MKAIDPRHLSQAEVYKLMTGLVVPRPIAWVSTQSINGIVNLAPFSSFTFVCHSPPMLAIGVDAKPDGDGLKDTARNILASGEFVVNVANWSQLAHLHASSAEYPTAVSEVEELGLRQLPSARIRTPRLADAAVSCECILERCLELGDGPNRLMIGRVVQFHVQDSLLSNGRIDSVALDPVSRLGGPIYAKLGPTVTMQRP